MKIGSTLLRPGSVFREHGALNKDSDGSRTKILGDDSLGVIRISAIVLLLALVSAGVPARGQTPAKSDAPVESSQQDAAKPTFDVWEYRILGNSVLAAAQIEAVIYPHLGAAKTIDSVEEVRKKLEALYRDQGFGTVFVDIPEQDVDQGIVRLQVTEGRIDRVRITGAKYFSNKKIRAVLAAAQQGTVPNLPGLQKDLARINRQSQDRSVTPVLKAGRQPGAVDLELKVEDDLPLHASIEANDRYTADTSKTRVSANVSYDNLWQRYHSFSLQYQTAPEELREARVLAGTYVAPVNRRNMFALYVVDTDSEVATVGTLSVLGKGRIYGARYIVPLPEAADYFQSITVGGDFKDFKEDVLISVDEGLRTPVSYANWSLVYSGNARTASTLTSFNLGFNFGIRGLGNQAAEFEDKRFKARPNYFYLRADATYERAFFWGSRLALRLMGQHAIEPLISNEQFSIGGADATRGYFESEALGDYGINGSLEIESPSIFGARLKPLTMQLHTFLDAGVVALLDALPDQDPRTTLVSTGLGFRFSGGGLAASLDWAYPLRSTERILRGDSRIHFMVRYGF